MGLFTADPLKGTYIDGNGDIQTNSTIDESSCSQTFSSSTGSLVNLAGGASASLSGQNTRPPAGIYPFAYIKILNTFGLKGSYNDGVTNWCTAGTGSFSKGVNCVPTEWDEDLLDFSNGRTCNATVADREMGAAETFSTGIKGTMKAVLATPNAAGTYVGDTACGNSTRVFGTFKPTAPIIISDTTKGLQVTFTVTDRGMTILSDGSNGVGGFSSGPFSPGFTLY